MGQLFPGGEGTGDIIYTVRGSLFLEREERRGLDTKRRGQARNDFQGRISAPTFDLAHELSEESPVSTEKDAPAGADPAVNQPETCGAGRGRDRRLAVDLSD